MRNIISKTGICGMVAVLLSFMACENELQVQQSYGFSLETMPVQKRISVGETVEIRCTLVREGRYDGARYTIRKNVSTLASRCRLCRAMQAPCVCAIVAASLAVRAAPSVSLASLAA